MLKTCIAGDLPPATAQDAEGVHRAPRVRPKAPIDSPHQEGGAHRWHHVPTLRRTEVRGDRVLRRGQQLSGTADVLLLHCIHDNDRFIAAELADELVCSCCLIWTGSM